MSLPPAQRAARALPLEPELDELRALGRAAVDDLCDFVAGLDNAPASDLEGAMELASTLGGPPPEHGRPVDAVLADVRRGVAKAFETAGPGYVAFIPGGGLPAAAVADLLACGTNRFVNMAAAAPALVAMEASAVRWMCDAVGLPAASQGILTSGGSLANLSAVVTARHAQLGERFLDGTLYVSDQAHHSVAKAARIAGLPADAVRLVPTDASLRLDVDALADAVGRDRAAGWRPFLVVASAGTTNTGVVDPLPAVAELARREGLWFHLDAAYGGFFVLTERGRTRLRGIEQADSVTLDPHKGMFLPYGTGCLLARDGEQLRDAHHLGASYLQDVPVGQDLPSFAELSPELSRDFRGLRVWLPLHLHGVGAFRTALDEKLDLTALVHDALRDHPRLEVPWTPDLSIVAFRHRDGDAATRQVLEQVNASQRVFLSSTTLGERYFARVCILSFRTHRDRIDEAIALIRQAADRT